ncbi:MULTISPECIES: hypothetical protein [unclassified Romboutsia]|uniref:hypothetical protein n=1 Tax=unclassified Romboutsia TaxID=2626894 RepID=UPI00082044F1|nr:MULTISPECIES: hypothetical protein [unclassified Romboutsia]SCI32983.1 Uncharacterised protein [uncultured Clostridium sp.]
MIEREFGKLIEKLIYFSGQKNYSLAMELGYDVSYISKWINSTMLPAAKNIKNISKITADFIVKSSSESSLRDISDYFEINTTENENKSEILKKTIEEKLSESYLYSYNKNNKKTLKKDIRKNNSIQTINPTLRKKYLDDEIISFIEEAGLSDMTVLCNLFSLNREDKVHLAGIRNGENNKSSNHKELVKMKYLISFDSDNDIKEIIFDVMLFINMVTSRGRINAELYSCDFPSNIFMSAVKNKCAHTAIYNNHKCITTITSTDDDVVDEMYHTLEEMISTQSRHMFRKKTPEEIIISQRYMNYIMDQDLRWLVGSVTELFMPSDLFLEIGKNIFGDEKEALIKLKKIDTILQNVTYNSKLNIIMYESVFRTYVSSGNMTFFNKPINLSLEQRQRHLSHMKKLLEEKDNINLKVIENSVLDDFKNEEKPSMYLSKNMSFLKENPNEDSENYLIINDKKLDEILKIFFDKIWKERINDNEKHESKMLVSESLRYIEILNDNLKF